MSESTMLTREPTKGLTDPFTIRLDKAHEQYIQKLMNQHMKQTGKFLSKTEAIRHLIDMACIEIHRGAEVLSFSPLKYKHANNNKE